MIPAVSFVSGAGGTGKTTFMRYLCETRKDLSILHMDDLPPASTIIHGHWYLLPSQTRRYYEEIGMGNEIEDAQRDIEKRNQSQAQLIGRYLKDLHRMLDLVPKSGGNLLMERSFIDHLAYYANALSVSDKAEAWPLLMNDWVPTALNIATSVMPVLKQYRTQHFYTPYPPFWGGASGADGFRDTNSEKNRNWGSLILRFFDAFGLKVESLDLSDYAACARAVFQVVEPLSLTEQGA